MEYATFKCEVCDTITLVRHKKIYWCCNHEEVKKLALAYSEEEDDT